MAIPTEPIGSIPRPRALIEAVARKGPDDPSLDPLYEEVAHSLALRGEAGSRPSP